MQTVVAAPDLPSRHCYPSPTGAWIRLCEQARPTPHRSRRDCEQPSDGIVSEDLKSALVGILPQLRRFARTLTRSATEADDLVQEACLRALAKGHLWDRSQPLDRWMFRLTRNLWIGEIRKRKVRLGEGHVPADESNELVSHETGEAAMSAKDIRSKIDALPSELSSVLLVVSVEGYSYAEAADLLDIPVGTVMSRLHRARKTLAGQLADGQGGTS